MAFENKNPVVSQSSAKEFQLKGVFGSPFPCLALTGGIACGKTTATRELEKLGWKVIDTDLIVRELYQPGNEGYKKVIDNFGPTVLNADNTLNRVALGQIVFSDPTQRHRLNALIHPLVRAVWQQRLVNHLRQFSEIPAVVVIPLLFEIEAETAFQTVATVACFLQTQLARLEAAGFRREEALQRIHAQGSLLKKIEQSHIVIWNNGNVEHMLGQVHRLDLLCRFHLTSFTKK